MNFGIMIMIKYRLVYCKKGEPTPFGRPPEEASFECRARVRAKAPSVITPAHGS